MLMTSKPPPARRGPQHQPAPEHAATTPAPQPKRSARAAVRSPLARVRLPSPLGPLLLAATEHGLAGVWFDDQRHHPGDLPGAVDDPQQRWLVQARAAFERYWRDGRSPDVFAELALDPQGTPFQRAVWAALRTIPPGASSSYGAIAAQIGRPAAARAVGAAVGRNPLGIVVPCHRVLGRDGALTGYAAGLARKQALLAHEGCARFAPRAVAE